MSEMKDKAKQAKQKIAAAATAAKMVSDRLADQVVTGSKDAAQRVGGKMEAGGKRLKGA